LNCEPGQRIALTREGALPFLPWASAQRIQQQQQTYEVG
jgi:hypothetical protein